MSRGKGQTNNKKVLCGKETASEHNILPFTGAIGSFAYDVSNDIVTYMNQAEADLWGWDISQPITYADVLASVDDPTKFMEQTLGHNKSAIVTAPIQIDNGKVVRETLSYTYHPEDYHNRSLIKIEGITQFLKVA